MMETMETDAKTGGQKASKLERYDLIPVEALTELARVYGRACKKYPDRSNWRKGYRWGLSFAAMMRHAWAWWFGRKRDVTRNHHLAQVAWHAFTLMYFENHYPQGDDRKDKKQ